MHSRNLYSREEKTTYSTLHVYNLTRLYESKGERPKFERDILIDLMGGIKNGESVDGYPNRISWVSNRGWLRVRGGSFDDNTTVGRRGNDRDVGVLQKKPGRKPSSAFRNVLENLSKI